MKRKLLFSAFAVLFVFIFSVSAFADTGPKPSVVITFQNLGSDLCYGTLLSKTDSTGPSSAWDGTEDNARYKENGCDYSELEYDVWKAFVDYEDPDGYYFLQEGWRCDETKQLSWTYYPPQSFKILLYFPQTETFAVSSVCERYAFDSYFTVDMDGVDIVDVQYTMTEIHAEKSYDYTWELISFAARVIITVVLEMIVALLFGFSERRQIIFIVAVNLSSQVILNVLLNIANYTEGYLAFILLYILLEVAVFVLEAVLYAGFLNRYSLTPVKRWVTVVYALVSNAVSFAAGLGIAKLIPGIF